MTRLNKLSKVFWGNRGGATGYTSDNGAIAFGDPMDLLDKRVKENKRQSDYRAIKVRKK